MPLLEILKYPETRLSEPSLSVTEIDGDLQQQIDRMMGTLYASDGLGLAAPQVGDLRAFFIYDLSPSEEVAQKEKGPVVLINPEIIEMEGSKVEDEGCLSIPGYFEKVKRAYRIQVKGLDREGKELRIEREGLCARLIQHEIDHLNGVLMLSRISSLKRGMFIRKFKKQKRKATSK